MDILDALVLNELRERLWQERSTAGAWHVQAGAVGAAGAVK